MNTNQNQNSQSTPSGHPSQTEQALPDTNQAKFPLGQLVATRNALDVLSQADILEGISRHARGDWGEICAEDRKENELSLVEGFRLMSVYRAADGTKFWVITEADRSATTVLLPDDY